MNVYKTIFAKKVMTEDAYIAKIHLGTSVYIVSLHFFTEINFLTSTLALH